MGYFGSKATSGLCQPLIAMMPPHDTYIETHLGGGALMRRKPAALHNIGIDRDAGALGEFECDSLLTQGARELPPIPPRQNGQRGKVAKSDAHNLWERMRKHETAVLRFAKHPDVAFTNNRAERDLRMSKVKQKVSGCFRTRKYAEAYCRISSYLQSMAYQGYNPLVAIQIALAGRAVDNMGE